MRLVILCSDDVFAGILAHKLLQEQGQDIIAVLVQSDIMMSGKTPWQTLKFVASKSGWRYPLYQAIELMGYGVVEQVRPWLGLNREPDRYLARPTRLAIKYNLNCRKIGQIHDPKQLDYIRELAPDLIISLRFSQIIKSELLDIPRYGIINFHGAMLPQYAGLGSVFQAIYRGERQVGFTVHMVDEGVDTGKIVEQNSIEVKAGESVSSVYIRVHKKGARLICNAIKRIEEELPLPAPDKQSEPSYYSWPDQSDVQQFVGNGGKFFTFADFFRLLFKYHTC